MSRLLTWSAGIAIAALLAAACGSDATPPLDAGESTTSTAPDSQTTDSGDSQSPDSLPADALPADSSLTASFRGVTETTIELGIASVDFDQLLELELIDFNHGDKVAIWEALLAEVNRQGGIHGRQLTAIYDSYLPVGNVEAEESCLYFTENNTVFAVLGLWIGDSVLCLTETHETIHVGQLMRQEWIDRSIAPLVSPAMAQERELGVLLDILLSTDRLDAKTVGVLTNEMAEASVETVLRPFLETHDIKLATVGVIPATASDQLAVDTEIARFSERWRTDGIDFLFVVGNNGVGSIPDVRDTLGSIDVAVLDAETFQQIYGNVSEDKKPKYEGVLSLGGLSPLNGEQFEEPLLRECVETVEAAVPGLEVVQTSDLEGPEDWFAGIRDACSSLAVFVAAATAAGTNLTNETFRAGVASLGSIDLPGMAFASFGPDKFDGEDGFRLVEFDPAEGRDGGFLDLSDIFNSAES